MKSCKLKKKIKTLSTIMKIITNYKCQLFLTEYEKLHTCIKKEIKALSTIIEIINNLYY